MLGMQYLINGDAQLKNTETIYSVTPVEAEGAGDGFSDWWHPIHRKSTRKGHS